MNGSRECVSTKNWMLLCEEWIESKHHASLHLLSSSTLHSFTDYLCLVWKYVNQFSFELLIYLVVTYDSAAWEPIYKMFKLILAWRVSCSIPLDENLLEFFIKNTFWVENNWAIGWVCIIWDRFTPLILNISFNFAY